MDIYSPHNRDDLAALRRAVRLLNTPSLTVKLAELVGAPLEWGLAKLSATLRGKINQGVNSALHKAADAALWSMADRPHAAASPRLHKLGAAASGALGGFFGFSALLVELPLSTTIMMRAVADVARAEGFSLSSLEVKIECVQVFALGGNAGPEVAGDAGYYAARTALNRMLNLTAAELAAIAAEKGAAGFGAREGAALLARAIDAVAARFGVVITEKMAAQIVPVLGALAGATVNTLFTDYYQDMAGGHFTLRRLELRYGEADIVDAYNRELAGLAPAG
ncbi:EcsC family protein [Rugamonas sp. CCM 8940]|uniref:EcsC family protein n=1 Tax=Rugamonas sp. CCM 8940 TaxID=2765359 RepID=UPI0018F3654D|nr:EcsC family protein [Rugamonas sp. CCM 8940]MBJ7311149.1 EcsC family protein [Rugamonas sp. CCM 8940]